jgi:hypothetical protein
MRYISAMLLAIIVASLLPQQASAQSGQRCFAETGYCISGTLRDYWERNGGLPVFGYPTSPQQQETVEGISLQVQWFERDRLEIQANGYVTAGRLGARLLELQWRPWAMGPGYPDRPGCRYFPQVGYDMCGQFKTYWEQNGGIERFGLPISPPMKETIEQRDYTVQYFERRRMELHPEIPGSPVLLGLLGNEVRSMDKGAQAAYPACLEITSAVMRQAISKMLFPESLGCPVLYAPTDMPGSIQRTEFGEMIWFAPPQIRVPGGVLQPTIFAIGQPPEKRYPTYLSEVDTWVEGVDPDMPPASPPSGRYAPWRGFGKFWANSEPVRILMGWAVEPQAQARRADYQIFEGGLLVRIYEPGTNGVVYAFGGYQIPRMVQRIQL